MFVGASCGRDVMSLKLLPLFCFVSVHRGVTVGPQVVSSPDVAGFASEGSVRTETKLPVVLPR